MTAQRQRPAAGHGVDGIEDEVGQRLPELGGVRENRGEIVEREVDLNVEPAALRLVLPAWPGHVESFPDPRGEIARDKRTRPARSGEILQAAHNLGTVGRSGLEQSQPLADLGVEGSQTE